MRTMNNTYIVGGVEINLDDPEFSGQKARLLNQLLFNLRAQLPDLVELKEPAPYGKYEYNFFNPGHCYDLKYACGHVYHATADNWFRPRCAVCGAAMEKEFATVDTMWRRRELPKPKKLLDVILTGKKE